MKTKILGLAAILLLATTSFSQKFAKGDKFIYAGLGLGGFEPADVYYADPVTGISLLDENGKTRDLTFSPKFISFNGQYFLSELISVGANLSFSGSTVDVSGNHISDNGRTGDFDGDGEDDDRFTKTRSETRSRTALFYSIRGFAHLAHIIGLPDKWDTYAGLSIGAYNQSERVHNIKNTETTELNYYSFSEPETKSITSSASEDYTWKPGNGLTGNLVIGGRYFFTEQIAAGVEIGFLGTYVEANIGFKF